VGQESDAYVHPLGNTGQKFNKRDIRLDDKIA
jgi:hypothetical protein